MLRRQEPRALVEREQALRFTQMATRQAWAGGVPDMQSWGLADIDPEPLVIHDLNGEPLFYEFTARDGEHEFGRVKASASRLVGSPVVTFEQGPRKWDVDRAKEAATAAAAKAYPRSEVTARDLVCYSYPKIGVRVEVEGKRAGSVICDVSDGSLVRRFGEDEPEGQTAWSFLDATTADDAELRLRRFDRHERELEEVLAASPQLFTDRLEAGALDELKARLVLRSDYLFIPFFSEKVLAFAPRCNGHECFELYGQHTSVYCAVATGQMILDFYRYHFDQDTIAAAMGTNATGTTFAGQELGYETLSNGCLEAAHDFTPTWAEAKAELDANRPCKSGISGHARACGGWRRQNITLLGATPKRWLKIYDPWPWNTDICQGGAVYWEDWDAVTHTNFCFVRHASTQH